MKTAQQEIRSTVTVNTIDLSIKKKDEETDLILSAPKKRGNQKKKGGVFLSLGWFQCSQEKKRFWLIFFF